MDLARRAYDQSSDEEFRSNILEYDDIQKLVHSDTRYDFLTDTIPKRMKFSEAIKLVTEANEREEIRKKEEEKWREEKRREQEKRKEEARLREQEEARKKQLEMENNENFKMDPNDESEINEKDDT